MLTHKSNKTTLKTKHKTVNKQHTTSANQTRKLPQKNNTMLT